MLRNPDFRKVLDVAAKNKQGLIQIPKKTLEQDYSMKRNMQEIASIYYGPQLDLMVGLSVVRLVR